MRVFVSSTCYDLVDLRAEVEQHLRGLGLVPVMSDRPTSDFELVASEDSIETCLVNVRKCDAFVCIVNQRYGGILGGKYGDISATHLELREARKGTAPMFVYVRDRLDAEHGVWMSSKDSPETKFRWVKNRADRRIFEMLKEHRDLSDGRPNWTWPFSNSVDLKDRLTLDLRRFSYRNLLAEWQTKGLLPAIELMSRGVEGGVPGNVTFSLSFAAASDTDMAFEPSVKIGNDPSVALRPVKYLHPVEFAHKTHVPSAMDRFDVPIELRYRTRFGALIEDCFVMQYLPPPLRFQLVERRLVAPQSVRLEVIPEAK